MIKLGSTMYKDVFVKDVSGLYDFPAIKEDGTDWLGSDYVEAMSRTLDYQYKEKIITLDCFMAADNWSELETKIENIISGLIFDGLKMLVVPDFSKRGYMVRLNKTTIFNPLIPFSDGKTIAEFKIVFEEPQPFNVQLSYCPETPIYELSTTVTASRPSRIQSLESDKQKYITLNVQNDSTEVNIEQENCTSIISESSANDLNPYPIIITGDIDSIESLSFSNTTNLIGFEVANLFMRNGSIA